VQMAISPWNQFGVVLVVSGNSDTAIIKAGQAASSGILRVGTRTDLALVAQVQSTDEQTGTLELLGATFTDIGYSVNRMKERGTNWVEYHFDIPPGYITTPEAYLDLIFNHSALFDYEQSGFDILLNDQTIGGVQFSDESTNRATRRVSIPGYAIRTGKNRLTIKAQLAPGTQCISPNLDSLWLTIWPESVLHLPLSASPAHASNVSDLAKYPDPFILNPTLGDTAFVLPRNEPAMWQIAAQIAFDLGQKIKGPLINLVVVYGDDVPENIRQERHLLSVGKASTLPFIAELGTALPAPFEPKSDFARERNVHIIYRFPQDTDMGYIELLPAPWNEDRVIVAALGSTDLGVQWSSTALTTPELRRQLAGNFAVISDEQIVVGNIRPNSSVQSPIITATWAESNIVTESSPSSNTLADDDDDDDEIATNEAENQKIATLPRRPAWILPAIGISGTLIVVIILIVAVSFWRRRGT